MNLVMPVMKKYFKLNMQTESVNSQKMNKFGEMEGGVLVYTDPNSGFTIDNYAKGKGFNIQRIKSYI